MKKPSRVSMLRLQGFDESYAIPGRRAWHVGCSQCAACVVNGVACHERGCPNVPREITNDDDDSDDDTNAAYQPRIDPRMPVARVRRVMWGS